MELTGVTWLREALRSSLRTRAGTEE